jgi:hypothetical protein
MLLMKVLEKEWRSKGIQCFVYLDDILLLGNSQHQVQQQLRVMVTTLVEAGFHINVGKSVLEPCQMVQHLGFCLNLKEGKLQVSSSKVKNIRKELGKLVLTKTMSCRKMAAILGVVRSCLVAVPFLRAFTDQMVSFVNHQQLHGWDIKLPIPENLRQQILEVKDLLQTWQGRPFVSPSQREIHSDSSTLAWAGLDINTKRFVHDFWREDQFLHINLKELKAAIASVKSLSLPGEDILLSVDNLVAYSYLAKGGGRLPPFNHLIRDFQTWCMTNKVQLSVQWVPSKDMQADSLSRWELDKGDYTLNPQLFSTVLQEFKKWVSPSVDMFASPGNKKFPQFVSRWPHFQAKAVDALKCHLGCFQEVYANPPWSIIPQWLHRLRQHPHLVCLLICPYWASSTWWPLLTRLHIPHTPCLVIPPRVGMFQNCQGTWMPRPRWPLLCILLSGKHYRSNRCQLQPLKIIWEN